MKQHDTDVLFLIDKKPSFVTGAIKDFLEADSYVVEVANINIRELEGIKKLPQLIVSDAEILSNNAKARVYLYDRCIEQGTHFIFVGETEQMDVLMNVTTPTLVGRQFFRPINPREVAEEIKEMIEDVNHKNMRKRVMVVDDSPTFLRTASEWLEDEYNVSICPSALAAIKMIAMQQPDLILLDYEMPVCSGAQFLEMLNNEPTIGHVPVIFLTSRSDAATVNEVYALHPEGYLLKTQPKAAILKSIRDFFEKQKISRL
ncbi:MAG: response regulator [Lachnospiraceae bacterium]|nr:response regulator [Lachnospiraceae bacterium]